MEPIVKSIAAGYSKGWGGVDLEDLLQDGRVGALTAAAKFTGIRTEGNTSTAPGFPAYAKESIRFAVSESVRLSGRAVVIAEDVWKRKARATDADVAAAEGWNITAELDAPTTEGYDLRETIAAPANTNRDLAMDIELAALALSSQERRVIRGVLDEEAMVAIAADLGVTKQRVTAIKTAAFAKLRGELEEYAPAELTPEPATPHYMSEANTSAEQATTGPVTADTTEGDTNDDNHIRTGDAEDRSGHAAAGETDRDAGSTRIAGGTTSDHGDLRQAHQLRTGHDHHDRVTPAGDREPERALGEDGPGTTRGAPLTHHRVLVLRHLPVPVLRGSLTVCSARSESTPSGKTIPHLETPTTTTHRSRREVTTSDAGLSEELSPGLREICSPHIHGPGPPETRPKFFPDSAYRHHRTVRPEPSRGATSRPAGPAQHLQEEAIMNTATITHPGTVRTRADARAAAVVSDMNRLVDNLQTLLPSGRTETKYEVLRESLRGAAGRLISQLSIGHGVTVTSLPDTGEFEGELVEITGAFGDSMYIELRVGEHSLHHISGVPKVWRPSVILSGPDTELTYLVQRAYAEGELSRDGRPASESDVDDCLGLFPGWSRNTRHESDQF